MKRYIIFLFLILSACSSSSVKEADPQDPSLPVSEEEQEEKIISKPVTKTEEPTAPVVAQPPSQYAALNEAIKSQNEEKIYQSATQILTQSPQDARALNALAMYQYRKGRYDLSRYLLNKGLSGANKNSEMYSNLGVVQLAQGERREAIKSFRKALEINGTDGVAAANLGSVYAQDKDYNKAAVALEIAYKRGLRDVRVLNNYGIVLTAQQKYERAQEVYELALKGDSGHKEVLYNYATLLIDRMGKYQEGLEQINRLKFVGGPADTRNRIIALENKAKAGIK